MTEPEPGSIIELLLDDQNKDAVEELVTQFVEKIEGEVAIKDTAISKGIKDEFSSLTTEINDSQQPRSRNIISEIIKTCYLFHAKMSK